MAFQFGAGTGGAGGFSFGTPSATTQANATAFGATTQPSFSFSTPTLQGTPAPAPIGGGTSNLFGGTAPTGGVGSLFGTVQQQGASSGFGMPPATQPATSAPAFSFGSGSLFGNAGATSAPNATTASGSLFGGGLSFGATKAAPATTPSVFGAPIPAPVAAAAPSFGGASTFGFGASGQPASTSTGLSFGSVQPATASSQPSGGFGSFNTAPAASTTGFAFGASAPAPTTGQAGGFAFGQTPAAATSGGGFSALTMPQQPATTANQTLGISFGAPTSTAPVSQPPATGFSFSTTGPPATTSGSMFGATKPGGFGTGLSAAQPATTSSATSTLGSLLKQNSTAATGSPALGSLNFGSSGGLSAASTAGTTSSLSGLLGASSTPAATSASALGNLLAAPATTSVAAPAFGQPFSATSASSFGTAQAAPVAASSSVAPLSFGLGLATTSTVTPANSAGFGLSFSAAPSSAQSGASSLGCLTLPTSSTVCTSAALTATSSSATAACKPPSSMTYRQLEESINKWTVELEEQEAIFLEQATQVNAWDRLLIDNGEKIAQLNSDVECVKIDQARLTQELDFILGQQRELEDLLSPLEQAMDQLPPINYQQHADVEREHTYKLAENIDAQLKQMATDLKEIVEHLNVSSGSQDSCDPLVQISKILNAHVDSLQWIDHNTDMVKHRLDSVSRQLEVQRKQQINKLHIGSN